MRGIDAVFEWRHERERLYNDVYNRDEYIELFRQNGDTSFWEVSRT